MQNQKMTAETTRDNYVIKLRFPFVGSNEETMAEQTKFSTSFYFGFCLWLFENQKDSLTYKKQTDRRMDEWTDTPTDRWTDIFQKTLIN